PLTWSWRRSAMGPRDTASLRIVKAVEGDWHHLLAESAYLNVVGVADCHLVEDDQIDRPFSPLGDVISKHLAQVVPEQQHQRMSAGIGASSQCQRQLLSDGT